LTRPRWACQLEYRDHREPYRYWRWGDTLTRASHTYTGTGEIRVPAP